jgi:hypothetical protein
MCVCVYVYVDVDVCVCVCGWSSSPVKHFARKECQYHYN